MSLDIILRDDDISYFTETRQLESVYSGLFKEDIPVCFSIIPRHRGNVKRKGKFETNTPAKYRANKEYPIHKNKELVEYLKNKNKEKKAELCLHGLNHSYDKKAEFEVNDVSTAEKMLDESIKEFQKTFRIRPGVFIPPYDRISGKGRKAVFDSGLDLCTNANNYPFLERNKTLIKEGNSRVFLSKNYLPTNGIKNWKNRLMRYALRKIKEDKKNTMIITAHYWQFFEEFEKPREGMIREFNQLVFDLKENKARVTTFSNIRANTH